MPNVDKHAPGSFCWIELATTDQNAAKQFYTSLLGWTVTDFPMGPEEAYSMFSINGRNTAAACTLRPEQVAQHVPPNWLLYIATDNADDTVRRATRAGGKVMAPAFDVMSFGRMAVLQDPTGPVFAIWQARSHTGTGISGIDGTLCWADVMTPDSEVAKKFYSEVFGWEITPGEKDSSGYLHIKNGQDFIGGMPPAVHQNPQAPPHWLPYFQLSDVDTSASNAKEMGAHLLVPPMSMEGVGRWSVIADPQGAVFAIFTPQR